MLFQQALQRLVQVLQQVPAVGYLGGRRCAAGGLVDVRQAAIQTDDLHAGMGLQPRRQAVGAALRR